nr:probable pectinesterase 29 [Ipomoea batatas]
MFNNLPLFLIFFFFFFFGLVNGRWQYDEDAVVSVPTIHVDHSGLTTNFKTIQSAIDSIPSNNLRWIRISIKPGVYKEKVTIPGDKQYIYLKGEGTKRQRPIVVWDESQSLLASPTFSSNADNIKVENLHFVNSYNYPPKKSGGAPMKQAVAAMITGDKTAFYRCGFSGVQDTLLDAMGRHYFKHCTIEGAVDFIFGAGQSIYEECRIVVNAGSIGEGTIGYITAQGRSRAQDSNAFVFKNSEVVGNGRALLGRAWRSYARTIFYNSSLSNIVVPQGWDSWSNKDYEHQLTFAEVECYGPGSDTSKRVPWEARLSQEMVKYFTSMDFIDGDQWIRKQPY